MKIVITGSSGNVGVGITQYIIEATSHFLVLVDQKHPDDRHPTERAQYITANLREYDTFLNIVKGADALIHLAAYAQPFHAHPAEIHSTNVTLSYNALTAAVEAGIKKVVMASSVNAIGGCWNKGEATYDYFPVDEDAPVRCEETYSLSKYIVEVQSDSIARANPDMTIATFRFHHVVPAKKDLAPIYETERKDLWGWTSSEGAARACLLAFEATWTGHEVMFIVAEDHAAYPFHAADLAKKFHPNAEIRGGGLKKDQSFYSTVKAERLLGWKHN